MASERHAILLNGISGEIVRNSYLMLCAYPFMTYLKATKMSINSINDE